MRVAPESSSAKPPRPEPRTSPILGRSGVSANRNCAADSALVKSSHIRGFRRLSVAEVGILPDDRPIGVSLAPQDFSGVPYRENRETHLPERFSLRFSQSRT